MVVIYGEIYGEIEITVKNLCLANYALRRTGAKQAKSPDQYDDDDDDDDDDDEEEEEEDGNGWVSWWCMWQW